MVETPMELQSFGDEGLEDETKGFGDFDSMTLAELAEAYNNTAMLEFAFGGGNSEVEICPRCGAEVTCPVEKEFMLSSGMCGVCDHVLGDAEDWMRAEAERDMLLEVV